MKCVFATVLTLLTFSAVANACLNQHEMTICSGDRATVDWLSGTVLGINPIENKVSIRFDNGQQDTYPVERVSIGKGCLRNYCVGDRTTVDWLSGKIIGLNPTTEKVSVLFDNGQQDTYSFDRVSLGKGCLNGYCVGDRATVEWLSGKIIAINPRNAHATILFDNGQQDSYSLNRISVDSYCLEYPEISRHRHVASREEYEKEFRN